MVKILIPGFIFGCLWGAPMVAVMYFQMINAWKEQGFVRALSEGEKRNQMDLRDVFKSKRIMVMNFFGILFFVAYLPILSKILPILGYNRVDSYNITFAAINVCPLVVIFGYLFMAYSIDCQLRGKRRERIS